MPIYRFTCRDCSNVFEFLKIRSNEVAECPKCNAKGEDKLEKHLSGGTSFKLKGDAWARDGYQRNPSKKKY